MLIRDFKKTLSSVFFIGCILFLQAFQAPLAEPLPQACPKLSDLTNTKIHSATLKWLPDGDTLHTKNGDKLRLLHINTPEINPTSDKAAEPFAFAAKQRLKTLLGSSGRFFWVKDKRAKDKYGRQLAFVFNQQGELLNARLVREGLAQLLVIPPNVRFWRCFYAAEKIAREQKKGLWKNSQFNPKQAGEIKANQGFQLVTGHISRIKETSRYRWLLLEDKLWVAIAKKDFHYFELAQLAFKPGQKLSLRGYLYHSHGELRVKLRHPAMILKLE